MARRPVGHLLYYRLPAGWLGGVVFLLGCASSKARAQGDDEGAPLTDDQREPTQKDAIRERLVTLAETEPPVDLETIGAECYEVASPPQRAEYVCPVCGERTLYHDDLAALVEWELASCRRAVETIEGLDVTLDESRFCRKCSPDVTDPKLVLEIRYEGEAEPVRVEGVNQHNHDLLSEFLSGSERHTDEYDAETPLKDYIEELEWVLGLTPEPLSREEITARLAAIAESPTPANLAPGAMCYAAGPPRGASDYVCPVCGEKTLYDLEDAARVLWELDNCRRAADIANDYLPLTLDESRLWRAWSPEAEEPTLVLRIEYEGREPHVVEGVSALDMKLIQAFVTGADRIDLGMGGEQPLKSYVERLEELLGVPMGEPAAVAH